MAGFWLGGNRLNREIAYQKGFNDVRQLETLAKGFNNSYGQYLLGLLGH